MKLYIEILFLLANIIFSQEIKKKIWKFWKRN